MKIKSRVAAWGRAAATLWVAHWVVIVGGILVFASAILRWIDFPFSQDLSGLQLPLLRNVELTSKLYLLSYGMLGIAALILGLISLRFSRRSLALAGAILLTLCVVAPCQIAFQRPALLRRLIAEARAVSLIRTFTKEYLPENYGALEKVPKRINLSTAWARVVAVPSFLGLGWYCLGFGSVVIAGYSITRAPRRRAVLTAVVICIPASVLVILLARPFIAQHYFNKAGTAQAQGHNEEAIANYRRAMRWDRWHQQGLDVYAIIGDLERQSGLAGDSPERHISKAQELKEAGQFEAAIFELNQVTGSGSPLAAAVRRERAGTRVELGLAFYHEGGIGAAVTQWEQALAEDPLQLHALVCLAWGNYDLARYQAALAAVERVLEVSGQESVLANAYSLGGDCYAKLGRDADARHYYLRSLKLDRSENYWALSGLIGE